MFWNKKEKIDSEEFLELKHSIEYLRLELESQKLELALYVKKLKLTKGIKQEKEESEKDLNEIIVPI
jgi:hypothetical protein